MAISDGEVHDQHTKSDQVSGDKITVGDVSGSAVAIGAGAQVIVERALTKAEEAERAASIERQRLAEAVAAYVTRLRQRAEAAQELPLHGSPYKSLLEYDIGDAALFYGRSRAIDDLLQCLERDALTVLHAESGAGKTSLLKAGIVPRLLAGGDVPIYVRPYKTPAHQALKRVLLPQIDQLLGLAAASLREFVWQVSDVAGQHVVVLFDQFEELFTMQPPEARMAFVDALAPCLDDESLPVRWVLAVRDEWFGQLGAFRPQIRQPFANEYLLRAFSYEEAREIIVEPARLRGVSYEAGLVEVLLSDLAANEFAPPQLQLVCSTLFETLDGRQQITRAMYEQIGGVGGILRGHLERVLNRDVPPEHRQAARYLLEGLVTSDKRRVLCSANELYGELRLRGVEQAAFEQLLGVLVDSRLLRLDEIETNGIVEAGYELVHDYLLAEIELDPATQSRKAAQELLAQETESYKRHGTLLSADELVIIEAQIDYLIVNDDARKLLDESRERLTRQRRVLYAGLATVALLVIVAIVLGVVTSNLTSTVSKQRESASALATNIALASDRVDQLSTLEAGARNAQLAAEARLQEAEKAIAFARASLAELFEQQGLVYVSDEPIGVIFAGSALWVTSCDGHTIHQIDPAQGLVVQTINLGEEACPLLLEQVETSLWVTGGPGKAIYEINSGTGRLERVIQLQNEALDIEFDGRWLWVSTWAETGPGSVVQIDPQAAVENAIVEQVPVGVEPGFLAWDGNQLWVANTGDGSVMAINPTTQQIRTIPVGGQPYGLTWDGGRLWVTDYAGNLIRWIEPVSGALSDPVTVGDGPVSMLWNGASLFVVSQDSKDVQQVDPATSEVVASLSVGAQPSTVAWDTQRGHIWVVNSEDNTVRRLNPLLAAARPSVASPDPSDVIWDGVNLHVADRLRNAVVQIDPATGAETGAIILDGDPRGLAWDGNRLWVASYGFGDNASLLQAFDEEGQPVATIALDGIPGDVASDGITVWVSNLTAGVVQGFDPGTETIQRQIPIESGLWYVESDGRHLWVLGAPNIDAGGLLQEIDLATGDVRSVTIGSQPTDLVWDGERLWVVDSGADSILEVEPDGLEVVVEIPLGSDPEALAWAGDDVWVALRGDQRVARISGRLFDLQRRALLSVR